ncbi:hypothetical protein ACF0H5_022613 [Mactra antiquata]
MGLLKFVNVVDNAGVLVCQRQFINIWKRRKHMLTDTRRSIQYMTKTCCSYQYSSVYTSTGCVQSKDTDLFQRKWHQTLHARLTHSEQSGSSNFDLSNKRKKWQQGTIPALDETDLTKSGEIEDNLFDYLSDESGEVNISRFIDALTATGLRETDPRLRECIQGLKRYQNAERDKYGTYGPTIDREAFKECISKNIVLVGGAFKNQFIIPDFSKFCGDIDELYWHARDNISGKVDITDNVSKRPKTLRKWSADSMAAAFRAVKTGNMSISSAARAYGVLRMSLADRVHNKVSVNKCKMGVKTALTEDEELALYIQNLSEESRECPPELALSAVELSLTPRKKRRFEECYNLNITINNPTYKTWFNLKNKVKDSHNVENEPVSTSGDASTATSELSLPPLSVSNCASTTSLVYPTPPGITGHPLVKTGLIPEDLVNVLVVPQPPTRATKIRGKARVLTSADVQAEKEKEKQSKIERIKQCKQERLEKREKKERETAKRREEIQQRKEEREKLKLEKMKAKEE